MRFRLPVLLGAAVLSLVGAEAHADEWVRHRGAHVLPPVSGTLHMAPDDFGHARPARSSRYGGHSQTVRVVRGGLYPRAADYRAVSPGERWATGGTGLSGLIGTTGNPYGGETQWGTADSATTGVGYAPRYGWQQRGFLTSGPSLADRYGEPPAYAGVNYDGDAAGYGEGNYGDTPQLPFYGSGTLNSMSYYSSGSSAGPYGSPGGLGTYRSGSYGYGPRIIRTGASRGGYARQGCTCGPRIVHLRRHYRDYSER